MEVLFGFFLKFWLFDITSRLHNQYLLKNFQSHLTYFLQIGGLPLLKLQGPERIYGQHDKIAQTPVVPLISLLAHQQNKLAFQLTLGTEEQVFTQLLELELATPQ